MKATQKLADLKDLAVVQNPEEVKGGFFFLFFKHYKAPSYQAPEPKYHEPEPKYHEPVKNDYDKGGKKGGKKGY